MLDEKVSEDEITMAIKYDSCFQDANLKYLKKDLKAKLKSVQDPHRLTKQKINRDFRSLEDKDKKEKMKSILNIENGVSVENLEEWRIELENELYYVVYGLVIRKLHSTMTALEMMMELLPDEEEELENVALKPTESQEYTNLT